MPYSNPYSATVQAPAPIKMPISTSSSNASSTTSSAAASPTRPSRLSRFVEGSEVTRPEILQRTPTSNEFLFHILSEMDAHEAQRKRNPQSSRASNSSRESLETPVTTTKHSMPPSREGHRSVNFGRMSLDGQPGPEQLGESEATKLSRKMGTVKGRIRAWTVGRDRGT
ncbi:hypothetical protein HYALB_00003403 [Hymenoscyphus albidus]|uniref:Uncharacterized protein n=1 Tax=Hymenoscyphus albidus TaxID=595503 RepID=A0A9N9Q0H4_9HELO|nr:hypothetical protein HYALB_00003403 [Hymenoscyphus albidus]